MTFSCIGVDSAMTWVVDLDSFFFLLDDPSLDDELDDEVDPDLLCSPTPFVAA